MHEACVMNEIEWDFLFKPFFKYVYTDTNFTQVSLIHSTKVIQMY